MMHCVFLYLRTAASDNETSASLKISQRESHLAPLAPVNLSPMTRQLSKSNASWDWGQKGGCEDEETADIFPITELKQRASPIAFMYIFLAVNEMEYVVFCYHRESSSTSVSEHIISFWGFTIATPDSGLLVLSIRRHSKHGRFNPSLWKRK